MIESMLRTTVVCVLLVFLGGWRGTPQQSTAPRVDVMSVPDGGIQPQAVTDSAGTVHLIYFKGEAAGGDLFYARRAVSAPAFSTPRRVNSEAGTAIATGSVRGGQVALGRDGWIHVAWNGSRPVDRDGEKRTPMWYSRLRPGAQDFEPQRAIGRQTRHLDGGGSIAADRTGRVFVVWHAAGAQDGETNRRLYVATSSHDGARFAAEEGYSNEAGACGCCGLETLVDARGALNILYRSAGATIHRDAMWMRIDARGATSAIDLQPWELAACPMTTFAMATAPGGIIAAWETQQQIHTALLDPNGGTATPPIAVSGKGLRKHPAVAVNAAGDRLIAWTEGTAWARGGSLGWELFDRRGVSLASASSAGAVPVWGLPAAIARPDGSFLVLH